MKKKTDSMLLSSADLCKKLRIHRHTLEKMVKEGLPVAGRKATRGRGSWTFDPDKASKWIVASGRTLPVIIGKAIKESVIDSASPIEKAAIPELSILVQLKAEQSQYQKLFAHFLRTHTGSDPAGVAALAKILTTKSEALRRLEMSALEYKQKDGQVVSLSEAERVFVALASACRDRIMALPNELAPILRDYLKRETDIGKVRDEIDKAVRHALESLPDTLPEIHQ